MFKDPDGVYESLKEASVINNDGTAKNATAADLVDRFIEFDEYIYVEFDTVNGTARVIEVNE